MSLQKSELLDRSSNELRFAQEARHRLDSALVTEYLSSSFMYCSRRWKCKCFSAMVKPQSLLSPDDDVKVGCDMVFKKIIDMRLLAELTTTFNTLGRHTVYFLM